MVGEMTQDQEQHYSAIDKMCREYYAETMKHGYRESGIPHYIFESAMMMVLGSDVFEILNKQDKERI